MSTDIQARRTRLIVGVDGSPSSLDALRWAQRLSSALEADIEAVMAWHYPVNSSMMPAPFQGDPAAEADRVLRSALRAAFGEKRPDGLRTRVCEGHPARVLLDASADAEMLVVGSRGRGALVGLLIGSVSAHCAEHARCPVLIAHHKP